MANVLLIFPPYLSSYKSPPLGLAYLGAYLRKKGHLVSIIDMDPMGFTYSDVGNLIRTKKPDVVGISAMTPQIKGAFTVADVIKDINKSIKVVVGGVHASALPEEVLRHENIDFVVIGEGELTFHELIESIMSKGSMPYEQIKGIGFRDKGIKITKPRSLIPNLDSLPFPLWDELPMKQYSGAPFGSSVNSKVYPILGTRGCPCHCTFCASNTVFRRIYRGRSANNIFNEILFLMRKYDAKQFDFVDDTVTINKNNLLKLCDLIIESKLDIKWSLNARVNTVDEELLEKIVKAGCVKIDFGIESGDPLILKSLKKGINLEQVKKAHRLTKDAGLQITSFFMVGNLGEDWDDIKRTVSFAKELNTYYPTCSIATPYPGTEMFKIANERNWIVNKNWNEYITTPYFTNNSHPIMYNGKLSPDDILEAYYYVNSEFSKIKLKTKYGRFYYLNIKFYIKEVVFRIKQLGFIGLLKVVYRLLKSKFCFDKHKS